MSVDNLFFEEEEETPPGLSDLFFEDTIPFVSSDTDVTTTGQEGPSLIPLDDGPVVEPTFEEPSSEAEFQRSDDVRVSEDVDQAQLDAQIPADTSAEEFQRILDQEGPQVAFDTEPQEATRVDIEDPTEAEIISTGPLTVLKSAGLGVNDLAASGAFSVDAFMREASRPKEITDAGRFFAAQPGMGLLTKIASEFALPEGKELDIGLVKNIPLSQMTKEQRIDYASDGVFKRLGRAIDRFPSEATRKEVARAMEIEASPTKLFEAAFNGTANNLALMGLQWGSMTLGGFIGGAPTGGAGAPAGAHLAGISSMMGAEAGTFLKVADAMMQVNDLTPEQRAIWLDISDKLAIQYGIASGVIEYSGNLFGPLAGKGTRAIREKMIGKGQTLLGKLIKKEGVKKAQGAFLRKAMGELLGWGANGLEEVGQGAMMNLLMSKAIMDMRKQSGMKEFAKGYKPDKLMPQFWQGVITSPGLSAAGRALNYFSGKENIKTENVIDSFEELFGRQVDAETKKLAKNITDLNNKEESEGSLAPSAQREVTSISQLEEQEVPGDQIPNGFFVTEKTPSEKGNLIVAPGDDIVSRAPPSMQLAFKVQQLEELEDYMVEQGFPLHKGRTLGSKEGSQQADITAESNARLKRELLQDDIAAAKKMLMAEERNSTGEHIPGIRDRSRAAVRKVAKNEALTLEDVEAIEHMKVIRSAAIQERKENTTRIGADDLDSDELGPGESVPVQGPVEPGAGGVSTVDDLMFEEGDPGPQEEPGFVEPGVEAAPIEDAVPVQDDGQAPAEDIVSDQAPGEAASPDVAPQSDAKATLLSYDRILPSEIKDDPEVKKVLGEFESMADMVQEVVDHVLTKEDPSTELFHIKDANGNDRFIGLREGESLFETTQENFNKDKADPFDQEAFQDEVAAQDAIDEVDAVDKPVGKSSVLTEDEIIDLNMTDMDEAEQAEAMVAAIERKFPRLTSVTKKDLTEVEQAAQAEIDGLVSKFKNTFDVGAAVQAEETGKEIEELTGDAEFTAENQRLKDIEDTEAAIKTLSADERTLLPAEKEKLHSLRKRLIQLKNNREVTEPPPEDESFSDDNPLLSDSEKEALESSKDEPASAVVDNDVFDKDEIDVGLEQQAGGPTMSEEDAQAIVDPETIDDPGPGLSQEEFDEQQRKKAEESAEDPDEDPILGTGPLNPLKPEGAPVESKEFDEEIAGRTEDSNAENLEKPKEEGPEPIKVVHFTLKENVNKILAEGFDTDLPPIHSTAPDKKITEVTKEDKFGGEGVLFFTTDNKWNKTDVYVGEGKGTKDYEYLKPGVGFVKEKNAVTPTKLEPIEGVIKSSNILTIDSLEDYLAFQKEHMDQAYIRHRTDEVVKKAQELGYDALNISKKGSWLTDEPNKYGERDQYMFATAGSGTNDFFIFNRDILELPGKTEREKKKQAVKENLGEGIPNVKTKRPSKTRFVFKPETQLPGYQQVTKGKDKGKAKYKGVLLKIVDNIVNAVGLKGAAKFNRETGEILFDPAEAIKKFESKAWTKSTTLRDKSKATPIHESQFKKQEDLNRFMIEHERQHSKISGQEFRKRALKKDKNADVSIGAYEDFINHAAFKAIDMRIIKDPIKPGKRKAPGTKLSDERNLELVNKILEKENKKEKPNKQVIEELEKEKAELETKIKKDKGKTPEQKEKERLRKLTTTDEKKQAQEEEGPQTFFNIPLAHRPIRVKKPTKKELENALIETDVHGDEVKTDPKTGEIYKIEGDPDTIETEKSLDEIEAEINDELQEGKEKPKEERSEEDLPVTTPVKKHVVTSRFIEILRKNRRVAIEIAKETKGAQKKAFKKQIEKLKNVIKAYTLLEAQRSFREPPSVPRNIDVEIKPDGGAIKTARNKILNEANQLFSGIEGRVNEMNRLAAAGVDQKRRDKLALEIQQEEKKVDDLVNNIQKLTNDAIKEEKKRVADKEKKERKKEKAEGKPKDKPEDDQDDGMTAEERGRLQSSLMGKSFYDPIEQTESAHSKLTKLLSIDQDNMVESPKDKKIINDLIEDYINELALDMNLDADQRVDLRRELKLYQKALHDPLVNKNTSHYEYSIQSMLDKANKEDRNLTKEEQAAVEAIVEQKERMLMGITPDIQVRKDLILEYDNLLDQKVDLKNLRQETQDQKEREKIDREIARIDDKQAKVYQQVEDLDFMIKKDLKGHHLKKLFNVYKKLGGPHDLFKTQPGFLRIGKSPKLTRSATGEQYNIVAKQNFLIDLASQLIRKTIGKDSFNKIRDSFRLFESTLPPQLAKRNKQLFQTKMGRQLGNVLGEVRQTETIYQAVQKNMLENLSEQELDAIGVIIESKGKDKDGKARSIDRSIEQINSIIKEYNKQVEKAEEGKGNPPSEKRAATIAGLKNSVLPVLKSYQKDPDVKKRMDQVMEVLAPFNKRMWNVYTKNLPNVSADQIEHYAFHVWGKPEEGMMTEKERDKFFAASILQRAEETILNGIEHGLNPFTLNQAVLLNMRTQSNMSAVQNTAMIDMLRGDNDAGQTFIVDIIDDEIGPNREVIKPGNRRLLEDAGFVETPHSALKGMMVDRRIVGLLDSIFQVIGKDGKFIGPLNAVAYTNHLMKESNMMIGGFHHYLLGQTGIGAIGIFPTLDVFADANLMADAVARGSYSLVINKWDDALRASKRTQLGRISEIADSKMEEVMNFAINGIESAVGTVVPGHGKLSKGVAKTLSSPFRAMKGLNKVNSRLLWDYLHNYLKIKAYNKITDKMLGYQLNRKREDAKIQMNLNSVQVEKMQLTQQEIDVIEIEVGHWVNNMFGGQLWADMLSHPTVLRTLQHVFLSWDFFKSTTAQVMAVTGLTSVTKGPLGRAVNRKVARDFWVSATWRFMVGMNIYNMIMRVIDERNLWEEEDKFMKKKLRDARKKYYGQLTQDKKSFSVSGGKEHKQDLYNKIVLPWEKMIKSHEGREAPTMGEISRAIAAGKLESLEDRMDSHRPGNEEAAPFYQSLLRYTMFGNPPGKKHKIFVGSEYLGDIHGKKSKGKELYAQNQLMKGRGFSDNEIDYEPSGILKEFPRLRQQKFRQLAKQFFDPFELFIEFDGLEVELGGITTLANKLSGKLSPILQLPNIIMFDMSASGHKKYELARARRLGGSAFDNKLIFAMTKAGMPFALNMLDERRFDRSFADLFSSPSALSETKLVNEMVKARAAVVAGEMNQQEFNKILSRVNHVARSNSLNSIDISNRSLDLFRKLHKEGMTKSERKLKIAVDNFDNMTVEDQEQVLREVGDLAEGAYFNLMMRENPSSLDSVTRIMKGELDSLKMQKKNVINKRKTITESNVNNLFIKE